MAYIVEVLLLFCTLWIGRNMASKGSTSLEKLTDVKEYCETEVFQPRCGNNEVIVMTRAHYGRMKVGGCVKKNLGYLGCTSDVLTLVDQRCSGRTSCQIRIPDTALDDSKPCLEELKTYLEAQYMCVRVMRPPYACSHNKQWVLPDTAGYITNAIVMDSNCGSMTSPLVISTLPGQQIKITLYNFDPLPKSSKEYHVSEPEAECDTYAHVIDKAAEKSVPVCRGGSRVKQIYVSTNKSVELVLYKTRSDGYQHGSFLLYYEAVGCPDIAPPDGMWVKRQDDKTSVGCHVTREVWQLVCVDGEWLGSELTNCSKSIILTPGDQHKRPHVGLSHGVSVIIIVTIAIGIGVVVLLCGIFVIKRMRKGPGSSRTTVTNGDLTQQSYEQEELEQLKVNYDNEMRSSNNCHPNDPEILQHVIYDKSKKDHVGYSPLHTCMHDAAHVQLRGPEVLWKANTHMQNHCDYESHKALNSCKTQKDNVAFVQPCTMTTFTDNSDVGAKSTPDTAAATASSSTPNVLDGHTLIPQETRAHNAAAAHTLNHPGGQNARSYHEGVYGERPATCVHSRDRDRLPRNPRNIYEPRRTRVLYTLNNSF